MPSFLSKIAARSSLRGCSILRFATGGLLFVLSLALSVHAESSHSVQATRAYHHAESLRQHLLAQPEYRRTRAQYESVLNAYRAVYHGDPAATEAPNSILAVAELLQTEGHQFDSAKYFQAAIGQYQFLRQQYPTSSLRYRALLAESAIQRDDLRNPRAAAQLDREFLQLYPHSPLAAQARADLHISSTTQKTFLSFVPDAERKNVVTQSSPAQRILTAGFDLPSQPGASAEMPATLQSIRYWSTEGYTRIAIDLSRAVAWHASRTSQPDRIVFHLAATHPSASLLRQPIVASNDPFLRSMSVHAQSDGSTDIALDVESSSDYAAFVLPNPDRLIVDLHQDMHRTATPTLTAAAAASAPVQPIFNAPPTYDAEERAALPPPATSPTRPTSVVSHLLVMDEAEGVNTSVTTASGAALPAVLPATRAHSRPRAPAAELPLPIDDSASVATDSTLSRVLGLKVRRIVIDAGHGGHDSGTLGPGGLEEKDVVLDVALRLGKLLQQRLGADVVYTRTSDTFIPLERRTAIANAAKADLFLSIHANSSPDADARGVETYFLNLTSAPGALAVAARENATSNRSVYELSDIVRRIALSNKIDESRTFALDVQQSLYDGLENGNPGLRNRGVKQAPFVVLIGANMPSILAEISFLTNRQDASELRQTTYRQRIAESLYRGVAGYVEGMGGVRIAENQNKSGR